jgi:hypothetical protein
MRAAFQPVPVTLKKTDTRKKQVFLKKLELNMGLLMRL